MPWRYLPPAHSPVSPASIAGGIKGMMFGRPAGLEQWLARRYEVDAALLVDSGTSALRLAIESLATATAPAARVALPAYACYDLATAAIGAGAEVSFYDIDPATLGPDWSSLGAALSARVDAVVLVHQYGVPVDIDRARALCDAHGAVVIEDAAQGAGAWWRHRRLGASGDLGILSFGRGKGMTAGGGGALLATGPRGRELLDASRLRVARGGPGVGSWVRLTAQALLSHPMVYGIPARIPWLALGETPYHEPWLPRAIDAAEAGVIQSAADRADREADIRGQAAARLGEMLRNRAGVSLVQPPAGDGIKPGWLRYPVLLSAENRARGDKALPDRLGIVAGYPLPLASLPQLRAASAGDWPGATRLAKELVTLPTHRWVRDQDRAAMEPLLPR